MFNKSIGKLEKGEALLSNALWRNWLRMWVGKGCWGWRDLVTQVRVLWGKTACSADYKGWALGLISSLSISSHLSWRNLISLSLGFLTYEKVDNNTCTWNDQCEEYIRARLQLTSCLAHTSSLSEPDFWFLERITPPPRVMLGLKELMPGNIWPVNAQWMWW